MYGHPHACPVYPARPARRAYAVEAVAFLGAVGAWVAVYYAVGAFVGAW
jgi:hypothetical protein